METRFGMVHGGRAGAAALTLALATALLAGCSGMGQEMSGAAPAPAAQDRGAAPEVAEEGVEAADGAAADGGGVDVADRTRIHTADLIVQVTDVEAASEEAVAWVEEAGGFVSGQHVSTAAGEEPSATLTLRVPQDRYEDGLAALGELGTRSELRRDVQDVTEEVADVDSRVESAEASLDRLRDLLDEADTVSDVLAVETEISTRQADLESLLARQEALADQADYATVTLNLLPPASYVAETEGESIGFLGGLRHGWAALLTAGRAVAVAVGWLLPFLVVAAVAAAPVVVVWRRRRARRAAAAPGGTGAGARPLARAGAAAAPAGSGQRAAGAPESADGPGTAGGPAGVGPADGGPAEGSQSGPDNGPGRASGTGPGGTGDGPVEPGGADADGPGR
ncbi:DUF4349 domain-containing protein [Nocardiopsis trehalosi]|jgi:hypothetical protein|uniref:DUF4349 domain-containing protein n=1 Tax=Nocardiopsis trehalosi TaxID=109329 RepID=UPI001FDFFACB|nr:DUF4349 domain-containing protein [Nocardiopsis trehalosi]